MQHFENWLIKWLTYQRKIRGRFAKVDTCEKFANCSKKNGNGSQNDAETIRYREVALNMFERFRKAFLSRRDAVVKDAVFKMLQRIRECVLSGL